MSENATYNNNIDNCLYRPTTFHIFVHISYPLMMAVSLIGNGIVCYLILTIPRMRSVTNFFIANLSIGDILITLCVPFSYLPLLLRNWPFGEVLCRTVSYFQAVLVFVNAYILVAISVDRYLAIMRPLQPRKSHGQAKWVIGFVWLSALITALPILIVSTMEHPDALKACGLAICTEIWSDPYEKFYYTVVLMILQYGVPIIVLVYTYTHIAIVVWGKQIPGEAENIRDQRIATGKRKMIKMMLTVVIVFTICWLPYNIFLVTISSEQCQNWAECEYLWFGLYWLAMSHTCYNPIIYVYMNSRFRAGFFSIFHKVPCFEGLIPTSHRRDVSFAMYSRHTFDGNNSTLQRSNTSSTYISRKSADNNYSQLIFRDKKM